MLQVVTKCSGGVAQSLSETLRVPDGDKEKQMHFVLGTKPRRLQGLLVSQDRLDMSGQKKL
jgi:hypothetical protein